MTRIWRITVAKSQPDSDRDLIVAYVIEARTAQQATKGLVDLTTNNARVFRYEVKEIKVRWGGDDDGGEKPAQEDEPVGAA